MLTKSHGLGNAYLVADPAELPVELTPERVRLLCDQHFGIGSDGLLVLSGRSASAYRLRIWNPDGSQAEKSGNGLRIFAKWLFDTRRARESAFAIETPGGLAHVEVEAPPEVGRAHTVTVEMGQPRFRTDLHELELDGHRLAVEALSVGNPHCVVFREQLDENELRRLGPRLERHPAFPERTNVQFAHVLDRGAVELLIWERGAGETLASGSSATAVVAAGQRLGLLDPAVQARMPGGSLQIRVDAQGTLWMRGAVEEIAQVTLSAELIARLQALP